MHKTIFGESGIYQIICQMTKRENKTKPIKSTAQPQIISLQQVLGSDSLKISKLKLCEGKVFEKKNTHLIAY